MTNTTKIILISAGTVIIGGGIWLWWRQKDAVPPSAVPVMQQARATLASNDGAGSATPAPSSPAGNLQALLASVIPGYIPL